MGSQLDLDDVAAASSKASAELVALRTELARLRAAIADAPHDMDCASIRIKDDGYGPVMVDAFPPKPCDCWLHAANLSGNTQTQEANPPTM